jgi:hypothetical protein
VLEKKHLHQGEAENESEYATLHQILLGMSNMQ